MRYTSILIVLWLVAGVATAAAQESEPNSSGGALATEKSSVDPADGETIQQPPQSLDEKKTPPKTEEQTPPPPEVKAPEPPTETVVQNPPPIPPPPPPLVAGQGIGTAEEKPPLTGERRESFPNIDVLLPEGEFSIRARKLIRNVLFESQINYQFVDGDIETFLRYKYYARDFTYRLGFFDTIEFPALDSGSLDFVRIRGGLLLFEYPRDYNRRYFLLFQGDFLKFGDLTRPDNDTKNIYAKFGYQFGTPFDVRLNSIVGESRGRRTPVLSAYREIGPQKLGLALGVTQALSFLSSDYGYTKLEAEGIKRFDFANTRFLISRLHVGTMLKDCRPGVVCDDSRFDKDSWEDYEIPRYDFFKLGGREALKGVDDGLRGTDEIHLTNEYFIPIFRNQDYKTGHIHWNNLFGVGYLGAGNLGFSPSIFAEAGDYVVDAGLGIEATLSVRDYEVYFTAIYARTVRAPNVLLEGDEIRIAARTSR